MPCPTGLARVEAQVLHAAAEPRELAQAHARVRTPARAAGIEGRGRRGVTVDAAPVGEGDRLQAERLQQGDAQGREEIHVPAHVEAGPGAPVAGQFAGAVAAQGAVVTQVGHPFDGRETVDGVPVAAQHPDVAPAVAVAPAGLYESVPVPGGVGGQRAVGDAVPFVQGPQTEASPVHEQPRVDRTAMEAGDDQVVGHVARVAEKAPVGAHAEGTVPSAPDAGRQGQRRPRRDPHVRAPCGRFVVVVGILAADHGAQVALDTVIAGEPLHVPFGLGLEHEPGPGRTDQVALRVARARREQGQGEPVAMGQPLPGQAVAHARPELRLADAGTIQRDRAAQVQALDAVEVQPPQGTPLQPPGTPGDHARDDGVALGGQRVEPGTA